VRGSIIRRGTGYSVVLDLGRDPQTGRRRQRWHSGYRTKKEASAALADLIGNVNHGLCVERSRQTVAGFGDEWLAAIEPTVRPATHHSYSRNLRLHVLPYVGSTPLVALDAGTLNGLYAKLLKNGRGTSRVADCRRGPCVTSTRSCTGWAKTPCWGRLARNPADAANPPRPTSSWRRPECAAVRRWGCAGPTCQWTAAGRRSGKR